LALISEKARSEFIVVPILLAARELTGDQIANCHLLGSKARR
jgi:hypothetical protein